MIKKKVLFLCTGNSVRSQMAEGFLKNLAGNRFEVFSAGSQPFGLNPRAVKVMAEVGLDISGQKSKSVLQFIKHKFDYVITLCDQARQACPIFPGEYQKLHWDLPDPAAAEGTEEEKLTAFRKIRDEIKEKILAFIKTSQ